MKRYQLRANSAKLMPSQNPQEQARHNQAQEAEAQTTAQHLQQTPRQRQMRNEPAKNRFGVDDCRGGLIRVPQDKRKMVATLSSSSLLYNVLDPVRLLRGMPRRHSDRPDRGDSPQWGGWASYVVPVCRGSVGHNCSKRHRQ